MKMKRARSVDRARELVELIGIEPTTSRVRF